MCFHLLPVPTVHSNKVLLPLAHRLFHATRASSLRGLVVVVCLSAGYVRQLVGVVVVGFLLHHCIRLFQTMQHFQTPACVRFGGVAKDRLAGCKGHSKKCISRYHLSLKLTDLVQHQNAHSTSKTPRAWQLSPTTNTQSNPDAGSVPARVEATGEGGQVGVEWYQRSSQHMHAIGGECTTVAPSSAIESAVTAQGRCRALAHANHSLQ